MINKNYDYTEKLDNLINKIDDPYLQELCLRMVGHRGKHRTEYLKAPAAKKMHHAYPGGLVEHSLEVAEFCIADNELITKQSYLPLNLDLLITAALLHDIAKIEEYEICGEIDGQPIYLFTEIGKMIGHLCLSAMWVYSEMEKIDNFPNDLKQQLSHIILSHHGRVEWGTAILPKTKEAEFFHMADHRSATIAKEF